MLEWKICMKTTKQSDAKLLQKKSEKTFIKRIKKVVAISKSEKDVANAMKKERNENF